MSRLLRATTILWITGITCFICWSLFIPFVGLDSQRYLAPLPAKILWWCGLVTSLSFYCTSVMYIVRKAADIYSSEAAAFTALLLVMVSIPTAFYVGITFFVAYESIPAVGEEFDGQQIYYVSEGFAPPNEVVLVATSHWLWLEKDLDISAKIHDSHIPSSASETETSTSQVPSESITTPTETFHATSPRADGSIEVSNAEYIERIGQTNMGFDTTERRYPVAVVQENSTWYSYPNQVMPGELYSSFDLQNGVAVASFGNSNGAKNFVTVDGGKTWKRFITAEIDPAEDIEQGEKGAFIWDARTVNDTYYVLLNYPSWAASAQEGTWYSSTDGANWHKSKNPASVTNH